MKLIEMKCPNCGAVLKVDPDYDRAVCEFCHTKILIDDEVHHIKYDNAEDAGYQFEKGRQRAQRELVNNTHSSKYNKNNNPPKQKRNTLLWVLGWIFFFPIPVMILIWRKKNTWDVKAKIAVTVAFWLIILIIGIIGNNNDSSTVDVVNTDQAENELNNSTDEKNVDNDDENVESTEEKNQYAEDDIVNMFITEYNEMSHYEMADIKKGNISTKYFGSTNGCYIEMINAIGAAANSFNISINGGNNEIATERMFETFPEFIHVLDSTVSDEQIEQVITEFREDNTMKENYQLGENIILTFIPCVELSKGTSSSRIDISSNTYGK